MTWTQSDPLFRFVPDARREEPRRAQLYTAMLNNPMRYLDPDGHEVWQIGTNRAKAEQTRAALQGIAGRNATVSYKFNNGHTKYLVTQTAQQAKAGANDRAAKDLVFAARYDLHKIVIHNLDPKTAANAAEKKQNQKASRMLEKHGGAAVGESTLASTGAFETPVAIDYGYATSHPVRAWDGSETEETADTVLGHEVLGHAWNELDESEARDYENKYLRSKHPGMKMRDRHKSAPDRGGVNDVNDSSDGCGIECLSVRPFSAGPGKH